MHALEIPNHLAGSGVEREQAVGVKIVTHTVESVKVGNRRSGWNEHEAALDIDSHSGPVIRGPCYLPCALGPGLVPRFAGVRDRVEAPLQFARTHVVSANISVR